MIRALIQRLLWSFATLLGTAILTFALVRVVPGDPARAIAGTKATPELVLRIRKDLGLDAPLPVQLGEHLLRIARGDLGTSYVTQEPVLPALLRRLPVTAAVAGTATFLWLLISIPLGLLSATRPGTLVDRVILVGSAICISLPAFWVARMLQYTLAYRAGWFPVGGMGSLAHLFLPALSLAILASGYYARLVHTQMVEILSSPYIRAARARGLGEFSILVRHGLRNALIPLVTILGMDVAQLLGGVLFVENVFAIPGIGTLAVQAIGALDIPVIMGTVLFSAFLVVSANLVVDIAYRWMDPRIRSTT
jgi:peptide/nickel transport system permease protein